MTERVRARRLTEAEGRRLQQIVRRGEHSSIRVRRALIIMASASGTPVASIARLVAAHEDTVRELIHTFNEIGLDALDPRWAGGRPRRISTADEDFIVQTARTRPQKLGRPLPTGVCASWPTTWPPTRTAGSGSAANACERSCMLIGSRFSAPAAGRSPPTRTSTPSWTASST